MRRFFFGLAIFALAAPMPLLAETTDRQIAQQIVKQLKSQKESGVLKGFNLDLQVEDGAVYLKGFVSEREQRRKAVEAARQVEGVKQVFNEIEIKSLEEVTQPQQPVKKAAGKIRPASTTLNKTPAPLKVEVDEELAVENEPTARDVELGGLLEAVVTEAVAPRLKTLEIAPRQISPEIAGPQIPQNTFRAPNPLQVTKELPLARPEVQRQEAVLQRSSREITEAIVDQYRIAMASGELQGFGIDVQVDQGVVWLKGNVSDSAQMDFAIEVARDVAGVKKIVNALNITQDAEARQVSHDGTDEGVQHAFQGQAPRDSDAVAERIAKQVVAGLQKEKQEGSLANFGIDVQVDKRVVWMSGFVTSADQQAKALNVARYIRGVEKVVNDIKIQGQGTLLRPVAATLPQGAQPQAGQPMLNYQMVPVQYMPIQAIRASNQTPIAFAPARAASHVNMQSDQPPVPMTGNAGVGTAPARFDHPQMPGYAWPSYAPSPNYGAVTYPKQYSPSAWPYIGPFYPYPQVPLGWRRVTLEWDDGWWNLKFENTRMH